MLTSSWHYSKWSSDSVSKNQPPSALRRPAGAEEGEAACRGRRGGGFASPTNQEAQSLSNSCSGSEFIPLRRARVVPRLPAGTSPALARIALSLAMVFVPGCQGKPGPPQAVTIFVAASTKDAIEEIAGVFKKEQGIEVRVSPGASNTLATQIAEGAPADLFLSANEEWTEALKAEGHALEARKLLGNSLAIAVPRGNPAGVKSPQDLRAPAVKKVALAGEKVPAGKYAEQALRSLGLYEALLGDKKIVRGQDVRVTLAFVERGEAEAGIVYSTDAMVSRDVETACRLDPKTHDPIVYPLVLLKRAPTEGSARKLYAFLQTAGARVVFERHGFTALE